MMEFIKEKREGENQKKNWKRSKNKKGSRSLIRLQY